MSKKRTYKSVDVEKVQVARLLSAIVSTVVVAIDVAKEAMVAGFADQAGKVHQLVRFSHPKQTMTFIGLLLRLREEGRDVQVVMEPTGTYGDALRFQLRSRDFPVYQVDPKRVHDASYVLDGNVSQHDPKACTIIAFLQAQGKSRPWREQTSQERHARILLKEHNLYSAREMELYNELEAMTAASWPELNAMFSHDARWPLELLARYPSAAAVAKAPPDEVRKHLRKVSRGALRTETIELVLSTAKTTTGATLEPTEEAFIAKICTMMLEQRDLLAELDKRMTSLATSTDAMRRVRTVIGPAATLALFALVGDPANYDSAGALEKACGLNLKERSSGKHRGKLTITKRGPAQVRKLLYFAALRLVSGDELARAWYQERSAYKGNVKLKAVVAVMRKLLRAVFHVARGEVVFDSSKLFDARRLRPSELEGPPISTTSGSSKSASTTPIPTTPVATATTTISASV
jgi:transposase